MKSKPIIIILVLACLGLGAGWLVRHRSAAQQHQDDQAKIQQLSTQWTSTTTALDSAKKKNDELQTLLASEKEKIQHFSNDVTSLTVNLAKMESEAKTAAKTAQAEVAKREAKIAELESQRDDLTKKMSDLNVSINGLEGKIAETERKLAASEGDRAFLISELKRLQAEKAELERKFNDLAMVREQVRKLRDELSIAKRLDWLGRGLFRDLKGGERMQRAFAASPPPPPPSAPPAYSLDVEVRQDGGTRIHSALTNAPGTNPPPATK